MSIIEVAFYAAVTGFIVAGKLTEPDMILQPLYNKLFDKIGPGKNMDKKPLLIWYISLGCQYCLAGQIALWSYFIFIGYSKFNLNNNLKEFVMHIFCISISIFFTLLFKKINKWKA